MFKRRVAVVEDVEKRHFEIYDRPAIYKIRDQRFRMASRKFDVDLARSVIAAAHQRTYEIARAFEGNQPWPRDRWREFNVFLAPLNNADILALSERRL